MSDDADWDPKWWEKERDASLERRKAAEAATSGVSIGDTFLIVTEGEVTEPVYFGLFLEALELTRVEVRVVPGDTSDPRRVVETARRLAGEQSELAGRAEVALNEPQEFDHVWAVIDTDVAARSDLWAEVCKLANSLKVKLAHSTPCFEYWLLLHLCDQPTTSILRDGSAAKAAVEKALGAKYSTNKKTATAAIATFIGQWQKAVRHAELARKQHESAGTPPPQNPSTDVDRLVSAIVDSLRYEKRKF